MLCKHTNSNQGVELGASVTRQLSKTPLALSYFTQVRVAFSSIHLEDCIAIWQKENFTKIARALT